MKLGMVTFQWGADWTLEELIRNCEKARYEGVELRTTHRHGVEVGLNAAARAEVRKRFADSPVACLGPGTACEFQDPDHGIVQRNIQQTRDFIILSHDIGGTGVKVRPNRLIPEEKHQITIERIGKALGECGKFAEEYNQEVRLEVHGGGTQNLAVIRQIMEIADHPRVKVCWNSNDTDVENGSVRRTFNLVRGWLGGTVHLGELIDNYPYQELFGLLVKEEYDGYCLAECPTSPDTLRVMRYYRLLFDAWKKEAGG